MSNSSRHSRSNNPMLCLPTVPLRALLKEAQIINGVATFKWDQPPSFPHAMAMLRSRRPDVAPPSPNSCPTIVVPTTEGEPELIRAEKFRDGPQRLTFHVPASHRDPLGNVHELHAPFAVHSCRVVGKLPLRNDAWFQQRDTHAQTPEGGGPTVPCSPSPSFEKVLMSCFVKAVRDEDTEQYGSVRSLLGKIVGEWISCSEELVPVVHPTLLERLQDPSCWQAQRVIHQLEWAVCPMLFPEEVVLVKKEYAGWWAEKDGWGMIAIPLSCVHLVLALV